MRGTLVTIEPLDPVSNTRIICRLGLAKNSKTLHADGLAWQSSIHRAPLISMDYMDVDFSGRVQTGKANLTVDTGRGLMFSRPAVLLNFITGIFQAAGVSYSTLAGMPGYSYARTGSLSVLDKDGSVDTFSANVAPINNFGLHSYAAITNVGRRSSEIDHADWIKSLATVTANNAIAPDGSTTMDKLIASASAGRHFAYMSNHDLIADNTATTVSAVASNAGRRYAAIGLSNNAGIWDVVTFDLQNGTVVGAHGAGGPTLGTGAIESLGSGRYRLTANFVSGVSNVASAPRLTLMSTAGGDAIFENVAGNGADGVNFSSAQLMAGTFPDGGPLIATTSASVTTGAAALSVSCANGDYTATYTFDDDTTQQIPVTVAAGSFTLHTAPTLNRGRIKQVELLGASSSPLTRDQIDTLIWKGAPVRIWSGDGQSTSEMRLEFKGLIRSGVVDRNSKLLSLQAEVNRKLIDVPLLNQEYGGGGGADGDPEFRGQLRPACFGNPINVPVIFFDITNSVGQIDAYGNVIAIDNLYEDAASFGAKEGDYASYSALVAASLEEGEWATCVALGLIRLGADPRGVITCDPVAGSGTPGAMMLRWLQTHANVSVGNIDSTTFLSLDTALATVLGHAAAVSYWTQSQEDVGRLIEDMSGSVNTAPMIRPDGKIAVARQVTSAAASLTFNRVGDNAVIGWRDFDKPDIWWRLKSAAAQTFRVHAATEIDFNDDIKDMGDHVPGETYREGMVVRLPSDGVRYLYVNAVPSTFGPPNATYWQVYEDAIDASVLTYVDGTPIETLKPSTPGANQSGGGLNELNDIDFLTWSLGTGQARIVKGATNGFAEGLYPWVLEVAAGTAIRNAYGPLVKVDPSRLYHFSFRTQRNSGVHAAQTLKLGGDWLDSAGSVLAAGPEVTENTTTLTAAAQPVERRTSGTSHASAAFWRPRIYTPAVAGGELGGNFRIEFPRVSNVEFGADVTSMVDGPSLSTVFAYDYLGAKDGWSTRDMAFKLMNALGQVLTGITWTYKVISGTVNGFTSASGAQSMTGAGTGTFEVSSLGANSNTVEVTAVSSGVTRTKQLELTKSIGDAPAGGGGGAVTLVSQTTGFADSGTSGAYATISQAGDIDFTMPAGKTEVNVIVNIVSSPPNAVGGDGSRFWLSRMKIQRDIAAVWTDQGSVNGPLNTSSNRLNEGAGNYWENENANHNFTINITGLTAGNSYSVRLQQDLDANPNAVESHDNAGSVTVVAP